MELSLDALFGLVQSIFAGAFYLLWKKIDKAESKAEKAVTELQEYKVHIAETYVSRDHLER